jgi:DNA adenine methylase
MEIQKPILKWVGGKTQILSEILKRIPKNINNYHEPFIGGMSVLLGVINYNNNNLINITGNIYAYDLNKELIYLYKNIQNNYIELYNETKKLIDEYNLIKLLKLDIDKKKNKIYKTKIEYIKSKERYFYWIREQYNNLSNEDKINLNGSSMFIFLNKTCFRGLYRIGPNGFNVPFGSYKSPNILDYDHLEIIHNLIKDVIFTHMDFKKSLLNIEINDFTYLDPPYIKENEISFVSYNKEGFGDNENNILFSLIKTLTNENKKIILSNSDNIILYDIFDDKNIYTFFKIKVSRRINSKKPNSTTNELLIMNY